LACLSLASGESTIAIAGGVSLILAADITHILNQARMLSPEGRCKTFAAAADGYVRGEGSGVIILKKLFDAVADGDRILAVIKGSAVNQDGRSNGLTAPNGSAQQAVIRQALARAGVQPAEIGYVEAHGTGTPLGDPIEVEALWATLGAGRKPDNPCLIGSVKTNIGHLEAAAGIAGLIKVVLCLQHGEIAPHLHLEQVNPKIQLSRMSLRIPTERTPWPGGSRRRYAGVSSFGFGGANAHLILEEAPEVAPASTQSERPLHLLTLSARTESALRALVNRYADHLLKYPEIRMPDICFTANTGRRRFVHRLAVAAESTAQLAAELKRFSSDDPESRCRVGSLTGNRRPKIAFLFSSQEATYPGMGRQLYETQPVFRRAFDHCADILSDCLDVPLPSALCQEDRGGEPIEMTVYTQPVTLALQYALFELWQSWGIKPDVVLGLGLGEYASGRKSADGRSARSVNGRRRGSRCGLRALPCEGERGFRKGDSILGVSRGGRIH
jgi:acyl transferase domain-containing protein